MPPAAAAAQKRKRPPTFCYFPRNRAKQLKKAWVETAKIKSKWKAQKRREGIISSHSGLASLEDDDPPIADKNDSEASVMTAPDVSTHENKIRPSSHGKTSHAEGSANTNKEKQQSLRDLFRKAYSKESLHTYKSDPLKKRWGGQQGRGRGRGGRQGDAASIRGRPNMKLRINAMLEKIKQDYS